MKCAKWVLINLLLTASALHALDISYGNFLTIKGIKRTDKKIVLPIERKKYHNVRILDKNTYWFVANCQAPCKQEVSEVEATVLDVRSAKERSDMWIASVAFNQAWQATFLVFCRGGKYSIKSPADLIFLQQTLKKQTEKIIITAVKELK